METGDKRAGKRVKKGRRSRSETVPSLNDLFEVFYEAKEAEGRSQRTLKQYRENYRYFMRYLEVKQIGCTINVITTDVVRKYIVYMMKEIVQFEEHKYKPVNSEEVIGLSPVTINTRLKTLRVWFQFLEEEGLVDKNPMKSIKNVTEDEEQIEVLTVEELDALLRIPNQREYSEFRDYVLMTVLLDGMTRISETLALQVSDIDFQSQVIMIQAKNAKSRKARMIPIQKQTAQLLKELIAENEEFETNYVFLTNYGAQMQSNHFRKRLKAYAEKAGITKNVHPHLFRHTSATIFLESGGDIRHLQMLLGHADLRMVIKYTHLSNKALIEQHKQYSAMRQLGNKAQGQKRKTNRKV